VPETIPHVVQGIPFLGVHYSPGNAVLERVRGHVVGVAASALDQIGADVGLGGDGFQHSPD
jgi:hypothetical protein